MFVQHELWRPRERAWLGATMRAADVARLRREVENGVRMAQSLGLDVVLGGSDPGFWLDHGRGGVLAAWLRRLPPSVQLAAHAAGRPTEGVPKLAVLRTGSLVATSSIAANYGSARGNHAYASAKAGVVTLMRGLAVELARASGVGWVGVRLTGEGYRKSATMKYWEGEEIYKPPR